MRILYNSKDLSHKDPFGTLLPRQDCRLCIHIPISVKAREVSCILEGVDGNKLTVPLALHQTKAPYEHWQGSFSLDAPGLYFYYFYIITPTGGFRLFKTGDDTNMECGDRWQVSCIPADHTVPQWAMGAGIYQVFPDRFCKSGECDISEKLQPFTVHTDWSEEVIWRPTPEGEVLNNDFYGGNFQGITEKLPYLASLGVEILYLNPICKSFSSHRYDTGDYKTPDPMLGTMEDFSRLCAEAHKLGIRVILDGVFSHTGSDSLYFDKKGHFGGKGAYCTKESPYYSWYHFHHHPEHYESWWGFDTLPTVNKMDPSFLEYIITGENSVIAHWLHAGCDGFRLDVADELPNEFLVILKKHLRKLCPDALLMGEVWEDASNKEAYGISRRYFVDGTLDSVMNYPFRTAILNFLRGFDDGNALRDTVMTIAENYPPQVLLSNMNLMGTHDTPRILTALVDDFDGSREEKAKRHLSPELYRLARQRLMLATVLQYALPGAPSIYYGDEAGMEGYKDPFNRRTYPWGKEDIGLLSHFRALGILHKSTPALRLGDIRFLSSGGGCLCFTRSHCGKTVRICVNASREYRVFAPGQVLMAEDLRRMDSAALILAPMGFAILED